MNGIEIFNTARKLFWPGRDFPDREKWLKRRYTPVRVVDATLFYDSAEGPYNPGINKLKREADAHRPAKRGGRQQLIRVRHATYRTGKRVTMSRRKAS